VGNLILREAASGAVALPVTATVAVPGRDVNADNWSGGRPPEYEDAFEKPPAAAVASMLRISGVRRRRDGTYYRTRIGWWASNQQIVVKTANQELDRTPAGKYQPAGQWSNVAANTYRGVSPAKLRTAHIPGGTSSPNGSTGKGSSPNVSIADTPVGKKFPAAIDSIGFLPQPLRESIMLRIPYPTVFEATSWRHSLGGVPDYYCTQVLKLDNTQAMVIVAKYDIKLQEWNVEQRLYQFDTPQATLPAKSNTNLIGAAK